jgi:hypothetical protein
VGSEAVLSSFKIGMMMIHTSWCGCQHCRQNGEEDRLVNCFLSISQWVSAARRMEEGKGRKEEEKESRKRKERRKEGGRKERALWTLGFSSIEI